jgi:hypothetical protein
MRLRSQGARAALRASSGGGDRTHIYILSSIRTEISATPPGLSANVTSGYPSHDLMREYVPCSSWKFPRPFSLCIYINIFLRSQLITL